MGPHLWLGIGVLLRGFVVARLAIGIIGSRRLIASRAWMIVVLYRCTSAWLHISDLLTASPPASLPDL
jgi:hypothetical protein